MEKHFCDLCDSELLADRLGNLQVILPLGQDDLEIAIAIRGEKLHEVCIPCLISAVKVAGDKWFGVARDARDARTVQAAPEKKKIKLATVKVEPATPMIQPAVVAKEEIDLEAFEAPGLGAPE